MSNAVENVRVRLQRATRALAEARVAYAVVGGNAVAAWVSRVDEEAVRNTRDVDLLLDREQLPAAIAALEGAGFVHRQVASLGQPGSMHVFLDGSGSRVRDSVHVIFAGERTRPEQPEPNATLQESEDGGAFRLVSLQALVRMELSTFLDKDRMHLRDLASVGLLDASWLAQVPATLRERLEQILATPEG